MEPLSSHALPNRIRADMNIRRKVTIQFKAEDINN